MFRLITWFFIGGLVATLAIVALPVLIVGLIGVWLVRALA